jgi:hypothetical protein
MEKNTNESNASKDDKEKISICNLMKEDTSEIIQKLESKIPVHVQNYSDLYAEYLHMFDDLFGTCYMAEKEFFDKLNIDQGVLRQIREHSRITKENYLDGIEMGTKMLDEYVKMRISAIKTFDGYFHNMMDSYVKMLSQFNSSLKPPR